MSFGVGPYGYGTPVPDEPLQDAALGSSRRIGTGRQDRGQYVVSGSNPAFDSDAHQLVILALTTVRGSTAIPDLGREAEPPDFGGNFLERKRSQIQDALAHLVADKVVQIDRIEIAELSHGRSFTRIHLTDLTRNQPLRVEL